MRPLDLLYPPTCWLCQRRSETHDLCTDCANNLPLINSACQHCGEALQMLQLNDSVRNTCGRCSKRLPVFTRTKAPLRFEDPVRHMVSRFKFQRDLVAGRVLAEWFAEHLCLTNAKHPDDAWPTALIPVPLHWWRYWRRGFNQSLLIAQDLQRVLAIKDIHLKVLSRGLRRIRHTEPQPGLDAVERRRNLRNAFKVNTSNMPAHVALVDDVMTTGTTMNECAKVLLDSGCERVDVWVLARALKP